MRKEEIFRRVLWRAILFFVNAAVAATLLLLRHLWGAVSLEQILFHLAVPLAGGVNGALPLMIFVTVAAVFAVSSVFAHFCAKCIQNTSRCADLVLAIAALACLSFAEYSLDLTGFAARKLQKTTVFDSVISSSSQVVFRGEKRNLLVIHVESLEETYNDASVMGAPLMPALAEWQKSHISFRGHRQVRGTSWTTAGVTASFFGLPLLLPIGENDYGGYETFLPGAVSLFKVLEDNGYTLEFLFPNDCSFGGIENLVRTHAVVPVVKDLRWFSRYRSDAAANHGNGWGLRDRYVFEQLRQDIALRAGRGPYAFFVETLDTHGPDTYYFLDHEVRLTSPLRDFRDVVRATAISLDELLKWLSEQDFAKDLTVVVLGDHLWMGNAMAGRPLGENREVFNLWVNALRAPEAGKQRLFTTPDFAPTILEAIGATLPDRRFGIGTSLFAPEPTLIETLGEDALNAELGKSSSRYARFFRVPDGKRPDIDGENAPAHASVEFRSEELFMRRGNGRFSFVLSNDGGAELSGAEFRASVLDANGTRVPGCASTFAMSRALMSGDIESVEGGVILPQNEGLYTLRLTMSTGGEWTVPLRVSDSWLWQDECTAPPPTADERVVLEQGTPLATFCGVETYSHSGYIYYKLPLDVSASDLLPPDRAEPHPLQRTEGDSFRWAAAPVRARTTEITAGLAGSAGTRVSLLPALRDAALREESDLAAYLKKLKNSPYLVLVGKNDDTRAPFLWAFKDGQTITEQHGGSAPYHYDGMTDNVYIDMNAYSESAIAASASHTRISLRINGTEYTTTQRGINFVVFDAGRGIVIDRASFGYDGDPADLIAGKVTAPSRLLGHRYPGMTPVQRGALLKKWANGASAYLWQGRIYVRSPWESALSDTFTFDGEAFSLLDRAVTAGRSGVLALAGTPVGASVRLGLNGDPPEKTDLSPLCLETDFCRYLRRLADPDFIVFISVLEEGARRLTDTHKELFVALGLDMSLQRHLWNGYIAVSDGGRKVCEKFDPDRISKKVTVGGLTSRLVSTGSGAGFQSSIVIDGTEYSAASLGMNIVVYSKSQQRVIDSVCFNTYSDLDSWRKDPRFSGQ